MKKNPDFPVEVLAQLQLLREACEAKGVECAIVLHKKTRRGNYANAYGSKLDCCQFFDSVNLLTQVCENTYGEGTMKCHCRENPKSALPQAIGLGRVFN